MGVAGLRSSTGGLYSLLRAMEFEREKMSLLCGTRPKTFSDTSVVKHDPRGDTRSIRVAGGVGWA